MASSSAYTYTISDFLEWHKNGQLVLDPEFQRGAVWTSAARTFLIDTILSGFPIPQVFLRTEVNIETRATIREVVDGQQRLRAIIDFANNKIRLSSKSNVYNGKVFADLEEDDRRSFLNYSVSTVQLIDVDLDDILEIFARLNSYSVKVTPAELRHAKYSEPVKWVIWNFARKNNYLWTDYKLVSIRDAVRMKHNSFSAELFISVLKGLSDGGEPQIDKFYRECKDKEDDYFDGPLVKVNDIIDIIKNDVGDEYVHTTFFNGPNYLILFNFIGFIIGLCPVNANTEEWRHLHRSRFDIEKLKTTISAHASAVDDDDIDGKYGSFVVSSKTTTQRRASRAKRFSSLAKQYSSLG